eukprot:TRINITY_DN67268_c4_g1_i1.p1 TRINITY_DN67268_c4_g1~~TRINITY_DN67268_c4_g1_i1.p1  ORF type:complete len:126 (-),score=17.40 TRINITY_DN67268_c4_g1_i1:508-885(-)
MKNLFYLFFLAFLIVIFAQENAETNDVDPSEEQPRVELDREAIEGIMRTVSPGCRSEIESAMETKSDVSTECQTEIQEAIQSLNIKPKTTRPRRQKRELSDEEAQAEAERKKEERRKKRKTSNAY